MLTALLLRLSEAGPGATLSGRAARQYSGRTLDRLLAAGVLEETAEASEWSPCDDCDCAFGFRPIRRVAGRIVAACPLDPGSDLELEPADLREFRIDVGRLLSLIGAASGLSGPVEIIAPGLWHLGRLGSGRSIVAALPARALRSAGSVLLLKNRGGPVTVLASKPDQATRLRLVEAGIDLVEFPGALLPAEGTVDCLDLDVLEPKDARPRLEIGLRARRVTLDGRHISLSEQLFGLLRFLAEQALASPATIEIRAIEDQLWGDGIHRIASSVRDPIRALRDALAVGAADKAAARSLVEYRRNPNGYRLRIDPADLSLSD